jgi:hydroxyacylglutathione hydrolase
MILPRFAYRISMQIEQLRAGGDNFSYVVCCEKTREAALIDPSWDAKKAIDFIKLKNLKLKYIINTHHHADHIGDNERVKNELGGEIIASEIDSKKIPGVGRRVNDGDVLAVSDVNMKILLTPGHTRGSVCILVDDVAMLTGDTLFIGNCGRTDLADGSDREMFATLQRLKKLPDALIVYPGHDYGDKSFDTLGNQKRSNGTLVARTFEEFVKIP